MQRQGFVVGARGFARQAQLGGSGRHQQRLRHLRAAQFKRLASGRGRGIGTAAHAVNTSQAGQERRHLERRRLRPAQVDGGLDLDPRLGQAALFEQHQSQVGVRGPQVFGRALARGLDRERAAEHRLGRG